MAIEPSTVLRQVSALFRVGTLAGLSDGELLDRFRRGPSEEAEAVFAALVDRHAAMVMQVCRRILGDRHDAEDAAQATFLVLARRAGAIRRGESVASWLYGTAARVAGRARRDAARRRVRERRGAEAAMAIRRVEPETGAGAGPEAWPELYEELGRLPDRFRLPVLLCHLEGLSYEQAAGRIGCPVRTIQSRLSRAREKLRARLIRRGIGPGVSAFALASAFRPDASAMGMPVTEGWKQATIAAAVRHAAGEAAAAVASGQVAALAEGVMRAMVVQRVSRGIAALLLVGAVAGGAGIGMMARSESPKPEPATAAVADDNRYFVSFKDGATVEVVAVSTVPTGPHTWWKPDGTPLAEAPCDTIESHFREPHKARVVLVRSSGVKKDDMFRWHPTRADSYSGGRSTKHGQPAPELEYYVATFDPGRADCSVQVRVASGGWTTETSHGGGGGYGNFVNGHKFCFGKARAYQAYGRTMTTMTVAHNFLGKDRRLVAVDRDGEVHAAAVNAMGSDGDPRHVLDLIDAEFDLPPDRIKEFQVQFRPYEEAEIKGIALKPTSAGS